MIYVTQEFLSIHRLFALAVIPWLLYAVVIRGDFVYDDIAITVVENPALTGEVGPWEILAEWERPLREFTYMLDHAMWGYNPVGYHLQNIAWHFANGLLVYLLLGLIGFRVDHAFWAAMIFSAHPINVESVAWISGRKELLCLFFELSCAIAFIAAWHDRKAPQWGLYALSLLCLVLALLSKQVAVMTPFLAGGAYLMTRRMRLETVPWRQFLLALTPLFAIVIAFALFRYPLAERLESELSQGAFFDPGAREASYSALSAILTPFATFARSLWLSLVPLDLTIERAFEPVQSLTDWRWIPGFILFGASLATLWFGFKRYPPVAFAADWFIIAWAPVSGALPLTYLMADRYLYIPGIGFALAFAALAYDALRQLRSIHAPLIGLAILVAIFSARTIDRALDWRDELSLWSSAVEARPENPVSWSSLGNVYARTGLYAEAFDAWDRALELEPDQPQVWLNRGVANKQLGDLDAAEADYRKALELEPGYGVALFNLALLIEDRGDRETALEIMMQAADTLTGKRNAERRQGLAHYHIARLLYAKSEFHRAQAHIARAERLAPMHAPLHNLKGMMAGSGVSARSAFVRAIELDPEYAEAYFNLGVWEWQHGQRDRAEALWRSALDFNPELSDAIERVKSAEDN